MPGRRILSVSHLVFHPKLRAAFVAIASVVALAIVLPASPAHAADTWTQVGENLDSNDAVEPDFGYAVDLSADGSIMATSSPYREQVFIYRWSGSQWALSETITGDQANAGFGTSLALSADGTTLVVGSPYWQITRFDTPRTEGKVQVFDFNGTSWSLTKTYIAAIAGNAGYSVDISADGTTVVIGNPFSAGFNGSVDIARKVGSTWGDVDDSFMGSTEVRLGVSVSASADGSVVAAGARGAAPFPEGKAYVFRWDGSSYSSPTVISVGPIITNAQPPVALSGDGTLLVTGAAGYDTGSGDDDTGAVFTHTYDGSSWNLQSTIPGTTAGIEEGANLAVSSDGTTLATTASDDSDGQTRVLVYDGSNWNQRGDTFTGSDGQNLGDALAFANSGYTLAIGSPRWYNEPIDNRAGRLQVFSWPRPATGDAIPGPTTYFSFFLPDGRECSSISPQRVQVGTMVELPGETALCQTSDGSLVAGWVIPVPPGFTGYGSANEPFPPGLPVRVIESQRFTLVPFEKTLTIEFDANIAGDDTCTPANLAHTSENGRVGYSWVPRADFAVARTWSQAPCTPDGHELVGWNTAGDGSGQGIELGELLPADWEVGRANSRRLYAVWSPA